MHSIKWRRLFFSVALSLFGRVCVLFGDREKPWPVMLKLKLKCLMSCGKPFCNSHIPPSILILDFIFLFLSVVIRTKNYMTFGLFVYSLFARLV